MNLQTLASIHDFVDKELDNDFRIANGPLGLGLFVKHFIKAGSPVLTFRGPVIGFLEALSKGEKECWPLQIAKNRYIDLEEPGCFANHSCEPNCGIINDRFLVSIKDIQKDQEIRYDYSTTVDEDHWSMECRCGSVKCRKIISDFKYIDESVRRFYLGLGIVQQFIADQYINDLIRR